ncbi:diacylglycerol kinase [Pantoea piersonii]|uniref:diacylglycerol kinase n=1 Tax=Pantoea piersonii TaxID=2364647 RepID=UPI0028993F5E|nr:diacylglycerol kinase [Pantoea piersonii]
MKKNSEATFPALIYLKREEIRHQWIRGTYNIHLRSSSFPGKKVTMDVHNKEKGLSRFVNSIRNSWDGLVDAVHTEDAFQQLLLATSSLIVVAISLDITKTERLLLIASCFLMLIVELLNTAIESIVDRISLELHPLSKRAKDLGGAAQLVTVVLVIIIWCAVLL